MLTRRALHAFALSTAAASATAVASAAPSGPHPRLFLDAATEATMASQMGTQATGAALAIEHCKRATNLPSDVESGFGWGYAATSCALAYRLTHAPQYAVAALLFTNALLDDQLALGDGAGGDAVVQHDTGYFIRVFAPYSAIVYDWLYDAPGFDEVLKQKMRKRFDAWLSWYRDNGYLKRTAGANYHAGYVFSATLVAIAEGGEAGAAGDALWATVKDEMFGTDLAAAAAPGGVLHGGDWAEGWQYGPLSVLEYALATRAVEEQGVASPNMDTFASDLVARYLHGSTPAKHTLYLGGDTSKTWQYADPNPRILIAAIAGTADESRRAWARAEMSAREIKDYEAPIFQALADARVGASTPYQKSNSPTTHISAGTATLFTRSSWDESAVWGVFTCSNHLVPDHQHPDAGNWVLTRGADNLVVDPSPYSSLSSQTSNAPAIDSAVLSAEQSPSQQWSELGGKTGLRWVKALANGILAARGDYADQFRTSNAPSDVSVALRDWVFVPHGSDGTVVLVDRVVTGDASRGAHFRIRTPAMLVATGGKDASGSVGASDIAIRVPFATDGASTITVPTVKDDCEGATRGGCSNARFAVNDWKLDLLGPSAASITVIDGTTTGVAPATLGFAAAGAARVLTLGQGDSAVVIALSNTTDASTQGSLVYRAPSGSRSTHVVIDAPAGVGGRVDVTTASEGGVCVVTVAPREDAAGGYDAKPLALQVGPVCDIVEAPLAPLSEGSALTGTGASTGGADAGSGVGAAGGAARRAQAADATSDNGTVIGVTCSLDGPRSAGHAPWARLFGLGLLGALGLRAGRRFAR